MIQLPKHIKVRCPNCQAIDLLSNQRATIRNHKIMLACPKCRAEIHITESQIEEWKNKAQSLLSKDGKKK